jgi:hypothetical protein
MSSEVWKPHIMSVEENLKWFELGLKLLSATWHRNENTNKRVWNFFFDFWTDWQFSFERYEKFSDPDLDMTAEDHMRFQKCTSTLKAYTKEIDNHWVEAVGLATSEFNQAGKILSRLLLYSDNRLSLSTHDCGAVNKFSVSLTKAWNN